MPRRDREVEEIDKVKAYLQLKELLDKLEKVEVVNGALGMSLAELLGIVGETLNVVTVFLSDVHILQRAKARLNAKVIEREPTMEDFAMGMSSPIAKVKFPIPFVTDPETWKGTIMHIRLLVMYLRRGVDDEETQGNLPLIQDFLRTILILANKTGARAPDAQKSLSSLRSRINSYFTKVRIPETKKKYRSFGVLPKTDRDHLKEARKELTKLKSDFAKYKKSSNSKDKAKNTKKQRKR